MGSQAEDLFRHLRHPQRLLTVPLFSEHFGSVEELHAALCSFATKLSSIDGAVLLQCDLAGRAAQEVGREIGLSRRQVQRRRKSVRADFIRTLRGDERPSSPVCVTHREPAKVSASRLHISVRTLWRERKRIRENIWDESDSRLERALSAAVGDMVRAWLQEEYQRALSAVDIGTALADALVQRRISDSNEVVLKAYAWAETIERTAGDVRLADAMFERTFRLAKSASEWRDGVLAVQKLRRDLRDPSNYGIVYAQARRLEQAAAHPLAKLSLAETLDAWNATGELRAVVSSLASFDDRGAARHDVARMRTAILALCLRPQHEPLARRCIAGVRKCASPQSRSGLLASAYEIFLESRLRGDDAATRLLTAIAAQFRKRHLRAETATTLYLLARTLERRDNAREAGEFIEEALALAHGRVTAKAYADLLLLASSVLGGSRRARVAAAFADALLQGKPRSTRRVIASMQAIAYERRR
jgi:tetratricopeptide (TPR) repeat protein